MEEIIIVGFGGHAKSLTDSIVRQGKYHVYGYTDVHKSSISYNYLGTDDVLQEIYDSGIKNAAIGIGYLGKGRRREEIFDRLKSIGYFLPVIVDPSAIISSSTVLEEGTFIGKNCILNTETYIGKSCIINTGAIVEHETNVSDFSHVSIGTILCGNVSVGRGAFIGANATIIQCRSVEAYSIVPAGATVR